MSQLTFLRKYILMMGNGVKFLDTIQEPLIFMRGSEMLMVQSPLMFQRTQSHAVIQVVIEEIFNWKWMLYRDISCGKMVRQPSFCGVQQLILVNCDRSQPVRSTQAHQISSWRDVWLEQATHNVGKENLYLIKINTIYLYNLFTHFSIGSSSRI